MIIRNGIFISFIFCARYKYIIARISFKGNPNDYYIFSLKLFHQSKVTLIILIQTSPLLFTIQHAI
jgi:hypothetical protein